MERRSFVIDCGALFYSRSVGAGLRLGVGFKRTAHNSHGVGEYISPVRYCEQRGSRETALNPTAYAALTAFLDSLQAFGGPVTRLSSWRPTACAFSRRRLCSGRRRIGDVSLAAGA